MRKKFIFLLLILMICGCSNRISLNSQLEELGYSEEDAEFISGLTEETQEYFLTRYNEKFLTIAKDDRFIEDKMADYAWGYLHFDDLDVLFKFINEDYKNRDDFDLIRKLARQKFFILDNLDTYIEYSSDIEDLEHLIGYVNVGAYRRPFIECVDSDTSDEMAVLGNKWNYLGEYEPSDLVVIDKKYGNPTHDQPLKQDTYDAFLKMRQAAEDEGINLYVASAYRSHDYQIKIYNGYLKRDPVDVVDTYSSRPGYSDHQTGLACDLLSYGYSFDTFESSKAFEWLSENAEKYGFILRYPKDKEDITGYIYESWHYRYVGEELARFINKNKLTYDEYHAYYVERGITYESA